jgi:hypothetical protein
MNNTIKRALAVAGVAVLLTAALALSLAACGGSGNTTTGGGDTTTPTTEQTQDNAPAPVDSTSSDKSIAETLLDKTLPDVTIEPWIDESILWITNEKRQYLPEDEEGRQWLIRGSVQELLTATNLSIDEVRSGGILSATDTTTLTYYVITKTNDLYMWGENSKGELGDGTGIDRTEPILVSSDVSNLFARFIEPSGSTDHLAVIYMQKTDNSLWRFGNGVYEPEKLFDNIAIPYYTDSLMSRVSSTRVLEIRSERFYFRTTDGQLLSETVGVVLDKVKYITRGVTRTELSTTSDNILEYSPEHLVLFSDGSLYSFDEPSKSAEHRFLIDKVAWVWMLRDHYFVILKNNELWGMGENSRGELGDRTMIPRTEFVKLADNVQSLDYNGYSYSKTDGTKWAWNSNDPTPKQVQ